MTGAGGCCWSPLLGTLVRARIRRGQAVRELESINVAWSADITSVVRELVHNVAIALLPATHPIELPRREIAEYGEVLDAESGGTDPLAVPDEGQGRQTAVQTWGDASAAPPVEQRSLWR